MDRQTELLEIYRRNGTPQMKADIAASGKVYDTQRQQTQNTYNRQIKDTNNSYEDMYRENAVQKLINERKIAEDMAGLGLTDSGLNRTQQTAVQLSYANSKNKIDTNRQKAVDTLTASLADAISSIDANKLAAAEKIRSSYESGWSSAAQSTYAKELEEQTQRQKDAYDYSLKMYDKQQEAYEKQLQAEKENNYIIKANSALLRRDYTGTLRDNGVSVTYDRKNGKTTYVDENSGKKTVLNYNTNPYTGTVNPDTANGTWDNGYQPNNIGGNKIVEYDKIQIYGNSQRVFKLIKGHNTDFYTWDRYQNKYVQVIKDYDGNWLVK